MKVHSEEKIKRLKYLRKSGYSINELVKELNVPKTTVWHHIQNISISTKCALILKAKRGGSKKRAQKNLDEAWKIAKNMLSGLGREKLIIISMLYWAEGSKKSCDFINSDGEMIKLYLFIIRKILNISEDFIKPTIRIFSGMNRKKCLNYWFDITKIPKANFVVRFNDGGTKCKTKYGMCRITIRKGANTLKLLHSLREQIVAEFDKKG